MTAKSYDFKEGFSVKVRKTVGDVFFAMGETHISECKIYDLYIGKKFIDTFDTFEEAKNKGFDIVEN